MFAANRMSDKLITEFTENYMEKIFYFCLKKTGQITDAEDLTQDIVLNIISSLNKGTIPTSFSGWVWKITRNRYSVWANAKHKRAESVTGADIGEYEIEDENESALDKMIHSEQLTLLRRELAFIGSEYRNIVVAYYFDNKSVREIASSLFLSEGSVKQRLYRARNILKEGMNMAREFGVRSYNPEDIFYSLGLVRLGSKDQPKSIMKHKLYTNILLEAYGNPSSAEELSLELGVALPYMENELEYLTEETLLIKVNGKYQTSFPIISKAAQEQVHMLKLIAVPEITKVLTAFVDRLNTAFTEQNYDYYGKYQDYESAKWTFLMLAHQYFEHHTSLDHITERPDGGQWDITGFQKYSVNNHYFVGNWADRGKGYMLQKFSFQLDNLVSNIPSRLTEDEGRVLYAVGKGILKDEDLATAEKLAEYGYVRKTGNKYEPAIAVMNPFELRRILMQADKNTIAELTALADNAKTLLENLYASIAEIIRSDLPKMLTENKHVCESAIHDCSGSREFVLEEALRQGYLLPQESVSPSVGAYIDINI